MHLLCVAGDALPEICARVACLMVNMEHNRRVADWGGEAGGGRVGLRPEAAGPAAFLQFPVTPRCGGPPATACYAPTVGVIYAPPGIDASRLLAGIRNQLANLAHGLRPDGSFGPELVGPPASTALVIDHFRRYVPVESTALVSISFHLGYLLDGGPIQREDDDKSWVCYGSRAIIVRPGRELRSVPGHISRDTFTWHILPVCAVSDLCVLSSAARFNALVASICLDDTRPAALEPGAPFYQLSPEVLAVPPPRPLFGRGFCIPATAAAAGWPVYVAGGRASPPANVIVAGGRLHVTTLDPRTLGSWRAVPNVPAVARAAVQLPPGAGLCTHCEGPLYGECFAVTDRLIAPYHLPLCRWCFGAMGDGAGAVRYESGVDAAAALGAIHRYARWAGLVDSVPVATVRGGAAELYYVLDAGGEAPCLLTGGDHRPKNWLWTSAVPPCYTDEALVHLRLPCIIYTVGAICCLEP